jgi:hypothetical protein
LGLPSSSTAISAIFEDLVFGDSVVELSLKCDNPAVEDGLPIFATL